MNAFLAQFMSLARRYPVVVVSVILLLLLGGVNYFLWQRQTGLTLRHERIRSDGEAMLLALAGHSRIMAQHAAVEQALSAINRNLITESDLAVNLDYFYQLESATRVRLAQVNQLSSQPAAEDSPYKAVPFSFRATGTYLQIMNFIRGLESGPRLLHIRRFSLSRVGDEGTINLDLTVEMLAHP